MQTIEKPRKKRAKLNRGESLGPALTQKRRRFVDEAIRAPILDDDTISGCYVRAGFAPKAKTRPYPSWVRSAASRMLDDARIAHEIEQGRIKQRKRAGLETTTLLLEQLRIALGNIHDFCRKTPDGVLELDAAGQPIFHFAGVTREHMAGLGELVVERFDERDGEDDEGRPVFRPAIRTKLKLGPKNDALKSLRDFLDPPKLRAELTAKDGAPLFDLSKLPDGSLHSLIEILRAAVAGDGGSGVASPLS